MPSLSSLSDAELIKKIKEENSSEAVSALIDRHSGCYHNEAKKYLNNPYVDYNQVIENKPYLIWQAALKYDSSRGSFSNFVTNTARYECYSMIYESKKTKKSQKVDIEEAFSVKDEFANDKSREIKTYIEEIVGKDERKKKIVMDRFFSGSSKPTPWRDVGKKNGLSAWGAILVANETISKIKEKLKKEYLD